MTVFIAICKVRFSRFDAAVLVSLHSVVDPQTPSMTPKVHQTRGGDIPYMYVDNAAQNVDVSMLFRSDILFLKHDSSIFRKSSN